jgi:hypothetical protein
MVPKPPPVTARRVPRWEPAAADNNPTQRSRDVVAMVRNLDEPAITRFQPDSPRDRWLTNSGDRTEGIAVQLDAGRAPFVRLAEERGRGATLAAAPARAYPSGFRLQRPLPAQ